ncbi:MAG: DMT family protein [Bacteroidales bacterium]|nr:DMT family protein [Bacteroidales bacterium]
MSSITSILITITLLVVSNAFMTFAWYGHLKLQNAGISTHWPLAVVILFSWGIALLEYCFMVPANRIGFVDNGGPFTLMQLKIIQEVITLTVFTIFVTLFFKGEQLHWNHFVAFLLLIAAVGFAFLDTSKA